jgi:hypothetical protein
MWRAAIRFAFDALQKASADYDGLEPSVARDRVRVALVGLIHLISDIFPNESRFALPLNELLYGLMDLDRGKVVPLLSPTKTPINPGNALADDLFRAIPAAAMTCLVDGKVMNRIPASRDILKRLNRTHQLLGRQRSVGKRRIQVGDCRGLDVQSGGARGHLRRASERTRCDYRLPQAGRRLRQAGPGH